MNAPLILIVDDEEQVGIFAAMILNRAGFRTLSAGSGRFALDLFTDEVDVLLTDWAMPEMMGGELAARLLKRKPSLRVLFMSGNLELLKGYDFALNPGVNLIQKPFRSEELINFVKNSIETRNPTAS